LKSKLTRNKELRRETKDNVLASWTHV